MKNTRANIVIFKAENVLQPYVVGKVGMKTKNIVICFRANQLSF